MDRSVHMLVELLGGPAGGIELFAQLEEPVATVSTTNNIPLNAWHSLFLLLLSDVQILARLLAPGERVTAERTVHVSVPGNSCRRVTGCGLTLGARRRPWMRQSRSSLPP